MLSLLNTIESTLTTFFSQFTDALGYGGYLGLVLGVEAFIVLLFIIKSAFSYEARLKRRIDKCNRWLFRYKKIDENNIKDFNKIIKKGPKRLVYYWQQFILYRDGGPSAYLSEENVIEKPLRTSSWVSNIRNLGMLTAIWSVFAFIFGIASQHSNGITPDSVVLALILPCLTALFGIAVIMLLKGIRVINLDDIYHIYHLFSRFLTNATADLTPYIDFNLLFTQKEIENGNPQLREYYENRARKIREEFEEAQKKDAPLQTYQFENVGVDGSLLLNRAMNESEIYINKKNETLSKIAQIESQKEALKRNFEDVQMNLQRQIQASKENIQKLIEQQAATTNRIEAGSLKNQQQKEVNRNNQLQKDYEQEETRYLRARAELDEELDKLKNSLDEGVADVQKAMASEYQTFFEKVMKSAYQVAEQKVKEEKLSLTSQRDQNEEELVSVQTQIKRLKDENDTLRDRLSKYDPNYMKEQSDDEQGHYDENGNYIYSDGSYHDTNGLFHDTDGKVYNMNGELVSYDLSPEEKLAQENEEIKNEQVNSFGGYLDNNQTVVTPSAEEEQKEDSSNFMDEIAENMGEVHTKIASSEQEIKEKAEPIDDAFIIKDVVDNTSNEGENTDNNENVMENEETSQTNMAEANTDEPENEQPKKKRGRPRKVVESVESEPKKKRGRPRKVETSQPEASVTTKKRGRPPKSQTSSKPKKTNTTKKTSTTKKATAKKSPAKTSATGKKRGRPRKTEANITSVASTTEAKPKKRGRPRKETMDSSFVSQLNELISQQENKLKNLKEFLNSEIDQVLEPEEKANVSHEQDDIIKAVETLKDQASKAKSSGQSEELAKINKRIEDLIKDLSNINTGDNVDAQ